MGIDRDPTRAQQAPERLPARLPAVPLMTNPPESALPDLVPLPAWGIRTTHAAGRDLIDFSATVWVGGNGQLDVQGFRVKSSPVMSAYQYFWQDGQVIGRARAGTMGFDSQPGHSHWHFEQFAAYRLLGMHEHGFWVPLTILFVLRPEEGETFHRLILRAVGTAIGLVVATALSFWLNDDGIALAIALTVATAFAYGLLTVQYALFTAAITTYAVLLADTLGEPALHAAGQRAIATAIGIAIAGAAFLLWSNPAERTEPLAPRDAAR